MNVTIDVSDELVEAVAARVLERLADRERHDPEDAWLRGAKEIAGHVGCSRSRVYTLATCTPPRIPVKRDGAALVARRSDLDRWVAAGGARCP